MLENGKLKYGKLKKLDFGKNEKSKHLTHMHFSTNYLTTSSSANFFTSSSDLPSFSIVKHTSQIARRASSSLPSALIFNMFFLGGNRCRIAMLVCRL